ncbi:MAG: anti-sigma factor antagonist [Cytophagia bacterium]|nr:MAG: anti-sigma factor antagonist [Cytophagia bacterium]TAG39062.1 MAG: anti-sigma factor antagonist [Cytophagia bacterium]TAH31303.1 MAG: anti-sigma factor antagonist [Cytophagales bacterium]
MQIKEYTEKSIYTIEIIGDLDASSAIQLDQILEKVVENGTKKVLIDCKNLMYIASAGLGVFVSHIETFKEQNVFCVLYDMSDKVKNIFQILGLDTLLKIVKDRETALQIVQ